MKFVVFDRDRTLTHDAGYTHLAEDLRWMPGVLDLLLELENCGIPAFVATNQSGVARGYYSIEQMSQFNALLVQQARDHGGSIRAIAVCPHLDGGTVVAYAGTCRCRKPETGLLDVLGARYDLNWEHGLVVGDKDSDLEAARRVGAFAIDARHQNWVQETFHWAGCA